MSVDRVNYLNIGLMALSCLAAYLIPFELFLFSYAVLGPLHYLTEISWLHDRNYFTGTTATRRWWLILVMITIALLLFGTMGQVIGPRWGIALFLVVFVTALSTIVMPTAFLPLLLIGLGVSLIGLLGGSRYSLVLGLLLATIVHVFIFTAAFLFLGALRSRSQSGLLSLGVFALCAVSFFLYVPADPHALVGPYIRESYRSFESLNAELLRVFALGGDTSAETIYESTSGLTIMRFIAFSYTYHYLNWFSKTSIIKWHEVSMRRSAGIVALWFLSLALYAHNYETGMMALYSLSILHVMLEFPLNHRTFVSIGRNLSALARGTDTLSQADG